MRSIITSFLLVSLVTAGGFVPNVGQLTDYQGNAVPQIAYYLELHGMTIFFSDEGIHYVQHLENTDGTVTSYRTDMLFPQAGELIEEAAEQGPEYRFVTPRGVFGPVMQREYINVHEVAEGVRLSIGLQNGELKYNLHAESSEALHRFFWRVEGAEVELSDNELLMHTPLGSFSEHIPAAWYGGNRTPLSVQYTAEANRVAYRVEGSYKQLTVDPLIRNWSTYIGGNGSDAIQSVAMLPNGDFVWCGRASDTNFPLIQATQVNHAGQDEIVLGRSNSSGTIIWSTYLGGPDSERGNAIAVAPDGNLYLTGKTSSDVFPIFNAVQSFTGGLEDAFLVKMDGTTGNYLWGTYLGGAGADEGRVVQVDSAGNILVAGNTSSGGMPFAQNTAGGNGDGWLAKFNPNGSIFWLRYYGGSGIDEIHGLAIHNARYYISGFTQSSDLVLANAAQASLSGTQDGMLMQLDSSGIQRWGTYWGGSDEDVFTAVTLDSSWKPVVTGHTFSTDLTTMAPIQAANAGRSDLLFARFDTLGALEWSTYLGGSEFEFGRGIAANRKEGRIYGVGQTASTDFPVLGADFLTDYRGGTFDGFWLEIANDALVQAAHYGGTATDDALAVAADSVNMVTVGLTESRNEFPLLNAYNFFYTGGLSEGFMFSYRHTDTPISRRSRNKLTSQLELFPNPSNGLVTIRMTEHTLMQLQVYSGDGRLVLQAPASGRTATVDVSNFAPGIYLLKAKTSQGVVSNRLMVY